MRIRLASDADRTRWDAFVNRHPQASPYHLFGWKLAIEETYGHAGEYLLAEEGGDLVGVLPLFRFKVPLLSTTVVSLPFCDVGGVLGQSDATRQELCVAAVERARQAGASCLSLRNASETAPIPGWTSTRQATSKVRLLLELPGSSEELLASFRAKLRSQIRRAEKNGLSFRFGEPGDVASFYEIFARNMRDLGSPVHSSRLFGSILRHYGDGARLGLVFLEERPLAAGILLMANGRACIPWASSLREYNRLSPNMLLYWEFLRYASDDGGISRFDFGRSTEGEGTYRFKLQWGAKPEPLHWEDVDLTGRPQSATGNSFPIRELLESSWSRMPMPVANFLGPRLRRFISL